MRVALLPSSLLLLACAGAMSFPEPELQAPLPARDLELPEAPGTDRLEVPDGTVREVTWDAEPGRASRIWVYTPNTEQPEAGWPTILIAPAGSSQLEGMGLGEGDRPEHLPYLAAGYQVVAYEIDGFGDDDAAMQQFAESQAGLANARQAFRYATQVLPTDPTRVFAVGHSSAGNLAMLFAAHQKDLAGAVVYNSPGDGCWAQSESLLAGLSWAVPDLAAWCLKAHPASHLDHLDVPLLLFASNQDQIALASDVEATRDAHPDAPIELHVLDAGDHYTSMIEAEVPLAIEWMNGRNNAR